VFPYFKTYTIIYFCQDGGRSDLGNFFANADANYHPNNSDINLVDVDPMDMSDSMQEAMHRSNLDMRYIILISA